MMTVMGGKDENDNNKKIMEEIFNHIMRGEMMRWRKSVSYKSAKYFVMQEVEMEDLEEIKEVGGRRYSKMTHLYTDIVMAQYIVEANSGDTGYRPLRSDPTLHQLPAWSTLIGRGMSRLDSHWLRAS